MTQGPPPDVLAIMEAKKPRPPTVTLWRILVKPYVPPQNAGPIVLPDIVIENAKYLTVVGRIVGMGEQAFTSAKLKDSNNPGEGSWVLYGKYAGQRVVMTNGEEYVVMNDDEVIAVVHDPAHFYNFA